MVLPRKLLFSTLIITLTDGNFQVRIVSDNPRECYRISDKNNELLRGNKR